VASITLRGLAHSYDPDPKGAEDFQIKPTVDHEWEDGAAYALLGPSGCGKSTLLNIISGLLAPSRGRILFGDRDVTDLPTAARDIAQVFQFPVVYDTMTVYQNLAFPLRNKRMEPGYVDRRVRQVAKMIGLDDRLGERARGLTGDAKQKISLGRGMVREDVNAILFDEPLTVIDPHMKWELRTQLKELHRTFGHTMIYVTHDQTEALSFADRVVVMLDGEVVQFGTPEELFARPEHTFVGYFIGSPGMNVLPAEIAHDRAIVQGAEIPLGRAFSSLPPGAATLGVRPEHTAVATGGAGLPVRIVRVEDVGRHKILRARAGDVAVNAILGEGAEVPADADRLVFDPDACHVYVNERIVDSDRRRAGEGSA